MRLETDVGIFWTSPHPDPDRVLLRSLSYSTLRNILSVIELAGVGDGNDYDDLYIVGTPEGDGPFTLDIDRATLVLWFQFETLNFLHVGGDYLA